MSAHVRDDDDDDPEVEDILSAVQDTLGALTGDASAQLASLELDFDDDDEDFAPAPRRRVISRPRPSLRRRRRAPERAPSPPKAAEPEPKPEPVDEDAFGGLDDEDGGEDGGDMLAALQAAEFSLRDLDAIVDDVDDVPEEPPVVSSSGDGGKGDRDRNKLLDAVDSMISAVQSEGKTVSTMLTKMEDGDGQREPVLRRKRRPKRRVKKTGAGPKRRRRRKRGASKEGTPPYVHQKKQPAPASKLYEKAMEMEEDLSRLRDRYDEIQQEKQGLQEEVGRKERVILETTSRLEEAMMKLHRLKVEMDRKQQELTTLRKENQTLAEIHSLNMMTKERLQRTSARGDRPRNRRPLSLDRMAKITELEDELKMKQGQLGKLKHEIQLCERQVEDKDHGIEVLEAEIRQFQSREEKAYRVECRNAELGYQAETLQKEIGTLKQISRMKSTTIEQLNLQIQNWKNLQESYADLQRTAGTKEAEVRDLLLKLNELKKENRIKEAEIQHMVEQRDTLPVECLEDDKRYLRQQITTSLDKRAKLDRTIQQQQQEIEAMQARLKQVRLALRDTKLDRIIRRKGPQRRGLFTGVEASAMNLSFSLAASSPRGAEFDNTKFLQRNLFLLMKKNAAMLAKRKRTLATILVERQTCIESLQEKIAGMQRKKTMDERKHKMKIRDMKKKIKEMKGNLRRAEGDFLVKEKTLKVEISELRRTLRPQPKKRRQTPRGSSRVWRGGSRGRRV